MSVSVAVMTHVDCTVGKSINRDYHVYIYVPNVARLSIFLHALYSFGTRRATTVHRLLYNAPPCTFARLC